MPGRYFVYDETGPESFALWKDDREPFVRMSASRARPNNPEGIPPRALKAGGGGGTSNGMEARVAKLEAHVEVLRADVTDMRASLAALTERVAILTERVAILTERVAHLPSKGFVITSNMTAMAFFSALILFGEKLKALIGV